MFNPPLDRVIRLYGLYKKLYHKIPNITLEELPSDNQKYLGDHSLRISDDLISEFENDEQLTALFTKGINHSKLSIFL